MTQVFLSIGSNVDREQNIASCLDHLQAAFGELTLSSVYESEAVGFDGSHFYNMIAKIETDLSVGELSAQLKKIEDVHGRDRTGPKFGSRTLDIDIVLYGDIVGTVDNVELPRPELYYNAFVLLPIAEIAADLIDPKCRQTYGELWQQSDFNQHLWKVDFHWEKALISCSQ